MHRNVFERIRVSRFRNTGELCADEELAELIGRAALELGTSAEAAFRLALVLGLRRIMVALGLRRVEALQLVIDKMLEDEEIRRISEEVARRYSNVILTSAAATLATRLMNTALAMKYSEALGKDEIRRMILNGLKEIQEELL